MDSNAYFRRSGGMSRWCGIFGIVAVATLAASEIHPARAQMTTGQPAAAAASQPVLPSPLAGLEILPTAYLWMPWIGAGVKPFNPAIHSSSGTVDFDQFAGHLSWVPFMGAVEVRDGPYGVLLDYMHAPVRAGISTGNIVFSGAAVGLVLDTGTAMFLYRPFVQPDQYLDVGAGVRAWGIAGGITLNEGLLPSFAVTSGTAWADPLIGVRYHRDLGNGFGATAYGDVGGFGVGSHIDWQVLGTIDYAANSWINLHAGFRNISFNTSLQRANLNLNLYGPILSVTFRL